MKKGKRGFTIVEVAIFLAVTGVLFLGVTAGVQTSVRQQRRNDAVQNFVEFLRGVYSSVENVQNQTPEGRSERAIYGKLVTFGESRDLDGGNLTEKNKIFSYTVVGDIKKTSSGTAIGVLSGLAPNVFAGGKHAGYVESYTPKWGAQIVQTCASDCSYKPVEGALLVIRHPNSGTIYTYYTPDVVNVNDIAFANNWTKSPLENLSAMGFTAQTVDFCVNPFGEYGAKDMADIRITSGAGSAAGIQQVPDYEAKCGAAY